MPHSFDAVDRFGGFPLEHAHRPKEERHSDWGMSDDGRERSKRTGGRAWGEDGLVKPHLTAAY